MNKEIIESIVEIILENSEYRVEGEKYNGYDVQPKLDMDKITEELTDLLDKQIQYYDGKKWIATNFKSFKNIKDSFNKLTSDKYRYDFTESKSNFLFIYDTAKEILHIYRRI